MDKEEIKRVLPEYVEKLLVPMNALKGDLLPVSVFVGREDGTVPLGTSAYENVVLPSTFPNGMQQNVSSVTSVLTYALTHVSVLSC